MPVADALVDRVLRFFVNHGRGNHAARNQFLDVYFTNLICPNASAVLSGEDYQE